MSAKKRQEISESLENYLEAIFHIVAEKNAARAKDIAERLKVTGASVTGALRTLADKGLVNYAPYDIVTLTPHGKKLAADVVRKHEALRDFFVRVLTIDEEEADETACKMEHAVSPAILKRFIEFVKFVDSCPLAGTLWTQGFNHYCDRGDIPDDCGQCISVCAKKMRERARGAKAQG